MAKKKSLNIFYISLFISLLGYFLIGFSSSAFAYQYNLTSEDCHTLIDYYFGTDPGDNSPISKIHEYFPTQVANAQASYDILFFTFSSYNNDKWYHLYALNSSQITNVENLNNVNFMKITFTGTCYHRFINYNSYTNSNSYNTTSYTDTTITLGTGAQYRTRYLLYTNDFLGVTGPYQNVDILDLGASGLILNTNSNSQNLSIIDTTNYEVNFTTISDNMFGYFYNLDNSNVDVDDLGFWYYNGSEWVYKELFTRYHDNTYNHLNNNSYLTFNYNNSINADEIYINDFYKYYNVIYNYRIYNSNDFSNEHLYFLYTNSNTIISNNTIDLSTFTDSYYNQFEDLDLIINQNENTSKIINSIENSEDSFSGDEPTFNDLPGIEIEDISEDFFTWLLTSFLNVLNNNDNTYIDIPIYNENYRIYSDTFILTIEPLRTFINVGWWFICGVPFLKFIRRTIEKLRGGNIPLSDDKSDLLGNIL